MKSLTDYVAVLYSKCVHCYPTEFRLEFEEEMREVFTIALMETRERHFMALIALILHEFLDLPKNLIHEHWSNLEESILDKSIQKTRVPPAGHPVQIERSNWMNDKRNHERMEITNNKERILSALPIFLFGLGISLTSLIDSEPWYSVPTWRLILGITMDLLPLAIIATVGLIALIRHIPDWSLTWVGSGFMGLVILVKTISEELAEVGKHIISQQVELGIVVALFLCGVALLLIVGVGGWQRGGLLSIGFSVTFTLAFLWAATAAPFYLYELAIWAGPISLLMAGMTYAYTNSSHLARIIILVGIGIANYASILLVNKVWHNLYQVKAETFSFIAFILFMLAFLICGPIIGMIAKPIQKTLRRA